MAAALGRRRPRLDGAAARGKRLVGAFASALAVGLGFTPLHLFYLHLRGMNRRRNLLACFLENIMAYHLLLLLLRQALYAVPATTRKQQRRQLLVLLVAAAAVFCHAFIVAAQVTAVALMGSRMNGDLIYNVVWAVKTDTWGETDAKYFFPFVLSATLAIDMAWLFWGLKLSCGGNGGILDYDEDNAEVKAALKRKAAALGRDCSVKSLCLTFGIVGLLRYGLLWRGYSPVANTVYSLAQYSQMTGPSNLKRSKLPRRLPLRQAHKRYSYNYTALPDLAAAYAAAAETTRVASSDTHGQQQKKKDKPNVVLIINDSFGNALLKTKKGLKAFPFYEETVQQHRDIFDFTNNRAVSANTLTAATAALLGSYVAAPDPHPDAWTYFDLPNLFTMGKALGYKLALFMPYEHEEWYPFTGIYEDRFDKIVSKNTLNGKAVNDMGMDDRLITAEVLKFLEEEGVKRGRVKQRQGDEKGKYANGGKQAEEKEVADLQPFIVVIFWNNMHTPFLQNPRYERAGDLAANQSMSEASPRTEIGDETKRAVMRKTLLPGTKTETVTAGAANGGDSDAGATATAATAAATPGSQTTTRKTKTLVSPDVQGKANSSIIIREDRAIHAMEIGNQMMQDVWETLESTSLLDNTLVSFQSDHGETMGTAVRKRLADPDSLYLATPLWMHIPPHLLSSSEREVLSENRDKLTSNMDLMPTFVEVLKWDTTENMFRERPSIFKHGRSLLRPVEADRLTSGWQGRPFVESCDWTHGFLFNATHTLILRAGENHAVLEAIDQEDGAWTTVKERWAVKDLPAEEVAWWTRELKTNHADMVMALTECFWNYL
ncbi:arylsulfatase [Nannochloropsis oceanica]